MDAVTGSSPEKRAAHRQLEIDRCIKAIGRGDVYGFPQLLVRECEAIIAEEDSGWARAERSAYGMGAKA
jgi:hypothetical protein